MIVPDIRARSQKTSFVSRSNFVNSSEPLAFRFSRSRSTSWRRLGLIRAAFHTHHPQGLREKLTLDEGIDDFPRERRSCCRMSSPSVDVSSFLSPGLTVD